MRNEMLRGRVLRYMYAFRLSRCGTRVAVCQQHFAKRHLTQTRNDENDFFFLLSFFLSLFLSFFVPTRLFVSNSTYTVAREKNDDYPWSVNAKISSTGRSRVRCIFVISLVEKSIGNDICDNRGFEESLSLSLSSFLSRDWNAVLETLREKSGCSKDDRYRRDIPHHWPVLSLSHCLLTWHDTMTVITTMNFKNAPNNEFLAEKGGEERKRRRRRKKRWNNYGLMRVVNGD